MTSVLSVRFLFIALILDFKILFFIKYLFIVVKHYLSLFVTACLCLDLGILFGNVHIYISVSLFL